MHALVVNSFRPDTMIISSEGSARHLQEILQTSILLYSNIYIQRMNLVTMVTICYFVPHVPTVWEGRIEITSFLIRYTNLYVVVHYFTNKCSGGKVLRGGAN